MMKLLTLILCVVLVITQCQCGKVDLIKTIAKVQPLNPFIFVPGVMGSQQRSIDTIKFTKLHELQNDKNWQTTWLSKYRTLFKLSQLYKETRMFYDPKTDQITNSKGIKTIVPGFGATPEIEYLDSSSWFPIVKYYKPMVDFLVKNGYERGVNLRGAPYDFRVAPDELEKKLYYLNLKNLIEETYAMNGNTPVVLLAHSMGAQVTLYFLTNYGGIDKKWKDKYIKKFIAVAPAFDGGVPVLQTLISGHHKIPSIPYFDYMWNNFIVSNARTFESVTSLLPQHNSKPLIITNHKEYGVSNYDELFADIGYKYGPYFEKRILNTDSRMNYPSPGVDTTVYYGTGIPTPEQFKYDVDFGQGLDLIGLNPTVIYGDGDGSVNTYSAKIVDGKWAGVEFVELPNAKHMSILRDPRLFDDILLKTISKEDHKLGRLKNILLNLLRMKDRLKKERLIVAS